MQQHWFQHLQTGSFELLIQCLEFEYNSPREVEIPIILRAEDKVYFKDSIKTKSDKVKYSKEITIDENVENSEIVYQLGALDSFQFTLTNIKLTKIK